MENGENKLFLGCGTHFRRGNRVSANPQPEVRIYRFFIKLRDVIGGKRQIPELAMGCRRVRLSQIRQPLVDQSDFDFLFTNSDFTVVSNNFRSPSGMVNVTVTRLNVTLQKDGHRNYSESCLLCRFQATKWHSGFCKFRSDRNGRGEF